MDSGLSFDGEYEVYGIGTCGGVNKIFIDPDDNCRPFWFPLNDFDIIDPRVPGDWEIFADASAAVWTMVMAYPLLTRSVEHFDGLLLREEKDMEIFAAIKRSHAATSRE
ncbi:MAG: hypothetical protein QOH47_3422 [Sphingomonadales bacterium]|jgi:hypothetical protein|nr:hypothetical protein [Sphingomonadales bacterium]